MMNNYISVRLSEIERLRRADNAHYMCIPRHEVEWLVNTLRGKMAECESLRKVVDGFVSVHECRADVVRDDYHYAYMKAMELNK